MTLGFCCLLLVCPFFQEDDLTTENLDTVTVQDRFTEAVATFDSVERLEAEPIFEKIIADLEAKETLDEEEHFIMTESLKCLGVIKFPNDTEALYERLIRFDPSYELVAKDISPKVVAVFTKLKQQLVGSLIASAVDFSTNERLSGAKMFVDGKELGNIEGETRFFIFTGQRTIEVQRPNYESYTQEMEIVPGLESRVQAMLSRNATEVHLVTVPKDVAVKLEGNLTGTTLGDVSPTFHASLRADGIDLDNAGSIVINDLQPGTYDLTFEKPCFKKKLVSFAVEENGKMEFKPVKLEPAAATLSIEAVGDNTGIVFLDAQRVGYTPVANHTICPGNYQLRVKFTDGEYVKAISLNDGETMTLTAEPLPSIAWFGLQEDGGDIERDLSGWIAKLNTWNIQTVDPNDTTTVPLNPFPILFQGEQVNDANRAALTSQLKADLYMAARVFRKKKLNRYLEMAFWTPLSKSIHKLEFDFRELDKVRDLLRAMDRNPSLVKPWFGIQTAKLRGIQGCQLIEVHPLGPLAGKATMGAVVESLNGNLLRSPDEIVNYQNFSDATLTIDGRQITVKPIPTISEVPFNALTFVPQAVLAQLEKLGKYHPDELIRKSARFNQARFHFFLEDYTEAFDIFSTMNHETKYGINKGTFIFYQALCFRKRKLASEASASFKEVLSYPNATLIDAYGPKAAYWAETELKNPNF